MQPHIHWTEIGRIRDFKEDCILSLANYEGDKLEKI